MKQTLFRFRYYLEMVSVPVFVVLVVHLLGHGVMSLVADHAHHHHGGLWVESVLGAVLLIFFVWIWHRPAFARWVPCHHDHCHKELPVPHVLAIIALCLHFFPEAVMRQQLFEGAFGGDGWKLVGFIGFILHALVDLIVAIVLSGYWKTTKGFWISLVCIGAVWDTSFYLTVFLDWQIPEVVAPYISIVSGFLLAMFIHKPHKPMACGTCQTHE